mgnify:CR=1 FL=1
MFAGAGAVHGDRTRDKPIIEAFGGGEFLDVRGVNQENNVEIAVANVSQHNCRKGECVDITLGSVDAGRKLADGHAYVRRPRPRARP